MSEDSYDSEMRISDEHRELISQLLPIGMPEVPCATCVPDVDGLKIAHADGCPVSVDVEATTESDRDWFAQHPAADFFYREISWGEAAQLVTVSAETLPPLNPEHRLKAVGRVRVERLADGMRIRRFDDVYFVLSPAHQ